MANASLNTKDKFEQQVRYVLTELNKYDSNTFPSLRDILPNDIPDQRKEVQDELVRLDWAKPEKVSSYNDHLKPTPNGRSVLRDNFKEFRTEYIKDFVRQSSSAPYLLDDCDNFPQPPSVRDWELRIEEMWRAGELIKHPNDTFSLPPDQSKPSISIDIGDKVYGSSFRDFKPDNSFANPTQQYTNNNNATKGHKTSWLQVLYWVVGIAVAITVLYEFVLKHKN